MGISRYPRPGQKISPELLAPVLDVPIPWRLLRQSEELEGQLSDLDESTWERLSPNVCAKLGAAVVREISSRIASLPDSILGQRLPIPDYWLNADDAGLENLELEARTYNCLVAEGLLEEPDRLKVLTIKDLLQIRSFGAKSLVDLLAALESLQRGGRTPSRRSSWRQLSARTRTASVSRYPRPGHRVAPEGVTEEILNAVRCPRRFAVEHELALQESLASLDESVCGESLDTSR